MAAPDIAPMLAGYGLPAGPLDGWAAEPKLDGWRAMVVVQDGEVAVRSRRGRALDVPELAPLADLGVDLVLDGELIAGDGTMDSFYALAPALARRRRPPTLTFAAFDLLWCGGALATSLPYETRRQALLDLELPSPVVVVPSWSGDDAASLLDACEQLGVEGVVLKRRSARYSPGRRTTAWRKVKCSTWRAVHAERRRPR